LFSWSSLLNSNYGDSCNYSLDWVFNLPIYKFLLLNNFNEVSHSSFTLSAWMLLNLFYMNNLLLNGDERYVDCSCSLVCFSLINFFGSKVIWALTWRQDWVGLVVVSYDLLFMSCKRFLKSFYTFELKFCELTVLMFFWS